jgi:hypothetical protein
MKNIPFIPLIIALTVLIGCTPEWEEKGFESKKIYNLANDLGFTTGDEFRSYRRSGCWDYEDGRNLDDVDLWRKSPEVCFKKTEDRDKAKEYNIFSQEEWFNALEASKLGGFYSMDNYLKAKKLDIESQAELSKYEYNEIQLSGIRTAGASYAVSEMCKDTSGYLIATVSDKRDQGMFLLLREIFDRKNSSMMSEINPLNDEESRAFENAKNNEFGNFYNQLSANASNQRWSIDYFKENCLPKLVQICTVARARNDRSIASMCDNSSLSAFGL